MAQPPTIPFPRGVSSVLSRIRSGGFLWFLVFLIVVIGIRSAIYTVPADAVGVVLRFGNYTHNTNPGLRFKIPFGVDRVKVVPVMRQQMLEFGFGSPEATNTFQVVDYDEQKLARSMITGDKNAATVEWVVQYRIADAYNYLFKVRNPEDTLRDSSESMMREMVGDRTVDEVLTIGRQEIEDKCLVKLQLLVDKYGLGFVIDQVQLKNVNPPQRVQKSFNEVNQAQQEREATINKARGEYNKAVPRARGEADRKIEEAQGDALKRINEAQGDANRFLALFDEYSQAPAITRQRLYLETMEEVLPALKRKVIVDEDATGVLPLLHMEEGTNPMTNRSK